jgi:hypothetical protein
MGGRSSHFIDRQDPGWNSPATEHEKFLFTRIRNCRSKCLVPPGPRGGRAVVTSVGGMRWTRAASARKERRQGGRRIEPNPVSSNSRATSDAVCVRRKRVVLTVVATVKPCGGGSRSNRTGYCRSFARRGRPEGRSAPGRARHRPLKPSRREGRDVLAALCFPVPTCAMLLHRASRVPAGARPSLRPRHF